MAVPVGDDRAIPATLALPWPCDTLLDEPTAEIGIAQDFAKRLVGDPLSALEPRKGFEPVDPHISPQDFLNYNSMSGKKQSLIIGRRRTSAGLMPRVYRFDTHDFDALIAA